MKSLRNVPIGILILIIVTGCSDFKVNADYDKEVDFNSYKSFSFLQWNKENSSLINELDQQRLLNAVKSEMMDRRYAYHEEGGELAVSLYIVLDQQSGTTAYTSYYGGYGGGYYSPGWGWGGGYATTTYSNFHYVVGTLVIDVYDESTKKLIWQAVASKTVDENPQSRQKNTGRLMSYVFQKYPRDKIKN